MTKEKTLTEEVEQIVKDKDLSQVDKLLEEAKGKFKQHVMIIGFDDNGDPDILTTNPQVNIMHYWLNKTIFKLHIYEMKTQEAKNSEG